MADNGSSFGKKSGTDANSDIQIIHWRIDQWFSDLDLNTKQKFKQFHEILLASNKTTSLLPAKSVFQLDATHFADSILGSRIIFNATKPAEIYDFGTGSGFPGVVFAILYPQTKVHLVDLDATKIEFLKSVANTIKITNLAFHARSMESLPDLSVQIGMTRGLSTISKTILLGRKVFKKGGTLFHFKGDEWPAEVGQIPTQLCSYWSPSFVSDYKLPTGESKLAILKTEKIGD